MSSNETKKNDSPLEYYRSICKQCEETIREAGKKWTLLSYVRGVLFLVALIFFACRFIDVWQLGNYWYWAAGVAFLVFLSIAAVHANIENYLDRTKLRLRGMRHSVSRCLRDWGDLPESNVKPPASFASVATDLDLFGNESLYQLVGTAHTPLGIETLTDWIANPAEAEEVARRQAAVAELKDRFEWRDEFGRECEYLGSSPTGPSEFVEWAEGERWLESRPWLLWFARAIAAINSLLIIVFVTGLVPREICGPILLLTLSINFLITVFYAGKVHDVFNAISSRKREIDAYQKLFGKIQSLDVKCELLRELKDSLENSKTGAIGRIHKLDSLVTLANVRRAGLMFIAYLVVQFVFLWDVHVLGLIEKWHARNGSYARGWFDALGRWECVTALAKLAWDQPNWVFPEVRDLEKVDPENDVASQVYLAAEGIGHPLIADTDRICNDAQVGPVGTVLLVTGSNMSGKSTLLRSIGVNQTLAQMGSVVCAKSMTCVPMRIESSMRIHDELAAGVSFFMAELKRLKEIVDIAQDDAEPRPLLFLLDEILQGTNSGERHIAVTRVVQALIESGAIGAISSHDLELADQDSLGAICQTVHFREHFTKQDGHESMSFDYVMRQGVSPTTNALKLLKLVGIQIDLDG